MNKVVESHAPYHAILKRIRDGKLTVAQAIVEAGPLPAAIIDPVEVDPLDGNVSLFMGLEAAIRNTVRAVGGSYEDGNLLSDAFVA